MKFSFVRLTIKVFLYLVLLGLGFWVSDFNIWIGGFVGVVFIAFLIFDLHDFRLRRFFDLFFLENKDWNDTFNLERDLELFDEIHKVNTSTINEIRNNNLLDLDINSSIAQKEELIDLFNELDKSLKPLNDLYIKYSVVAGFENSESKKAFFISIASFLDIYLIGRLLSDCSNFGAKLLDGKFNSIQSLVRSMIFPSTQIYLRSGFYILRKLKFKDKTFSMIQKSFVKDVLYVNEIGSFPLMSTVRYYVSLFNLFKRRGVMPLQKNISLLASETKVRDGRKAMTKDDVRKVLEAAQPGDIVLTRQASYLTGVLIPGYWTHASLYMGDKNDLIDMFGSDFSNLEELMDFDASEKVLLEAVGAGVTASKAKDALLADSIIVLRPKVGVYDKLRALKFVLENLNKEYNFTFDFSDEESFICSELVYKAYSDHDTGKQIIGFEIKSILGNWTFTPQDMFDSFLAGNDHLEIVVSYLHNKTFSKAVMGEFKDLKKLK